MQPADRTLTTSMGELGLLDYGGSGPSVLFVHDAMGNAASWLSVVERLAGSVRAVALDMDGHGQSRMAPLRQRDVHVVLQDVCRLLELNRPLVVGEGVGGWDVALAAIHRYLKPRGVLVLEAGYAGTREQTGRYLAQFDSEEFVRLMTQRFRLGWTGDDTARRELIQTLVDEAGRDWLRSEIAPALVRAVGERSMLKTNAGWLRQPTPETLANAMETPHNRDTFPNGELYDELDVPCWFVMSTQGYYFDNRETFDAFVAARPGRRLITVDTAQSIAESRPDQVASAITELLAATAATAATA